MSKNWFLTVTPPHCKIAHYNGSYHTVQWVIFLFLNKYIMYKKRNNGRDDVRGAGGRAGAAGAAKKARAREIRGATLPIVEMVSYL